jgi:hypothetical protein
VRDLESGRGQKRIAGDIDDSVRVRDLESDRGHKRVGEDLDDSQRIRDLEEPEAMPMDAQQNVWLDEVAACAQSGPPWFCEITGKPLDEKEVEKAMLKEIKMIDSFDTFREVTQEDLKTMNHRNPMGDHLKTVAGEPEQCQGEVGDSGRELRVSHGHFCGDPDRFERPTCTSTSDGENLEGWIV